MQSGWPAGQPLFVYSYAFSSPTNYTDPSGLCARFPIADTACLAVFERITSKYPNVKIGLGYYQVRGGHQAIWTERELLYVEEALDMVYNAFDDALAFQYVFTNLTFHRRDQHIQTALGFGTVAGWVWTGTTNIYLYDAAFGLQDTSSTIETESATMIVIHEMGHVFDQTELRKNWPTGMPWYVGFVSTTGGTVTGQPTTIGFTGDYCRGPNIYIPFYEQGLRELEVEDFANAFLLWTLYNNGVFRSDPIWGGTEEAQVYETYQLSIDYVEQVVSYYRNTY